MQHAEPSSLEPITLPQAKVLAHPLRRRILAAFGEEELALPQVADALDEPLQQLRPHVELLERAALLRCTRVAASTEGALPYFKAETREMVVPLGEEAPDSVAEFLHGTLKAGSEEALRALDGERAREAEDDLYMSVNSVVHADDAALRELTEFVVDWVRRNRPAREDTPPSQVTLVSFPLKAGGGD